MFAQRQALFFFIIYALIQPLFFIIESATYTLSFRLLFVHNSAHI